MSESWEILKSGAGTAAQNMAVDEALLFFASASQRPVLRFYSWSEPAASFGYSQRYEEAVQLTSLRPLVRRPTGGGLVSHASDWTYSLVFPPSHFWAQLRAVESYKAVHEWIQAAFSSIGLDAQLEQTGSTAKRGDCFARAERWDLIWQGTKLCGAAQRRNRSGLLIQGSIRAATGETFELLLTSTTNLPSEESKGVRNIWETAMLTVAKSRFDVEWSEYGTSKEWTSFVKELETTKYSQARHNQSR